MIKSRTEGDQLSSFWIDSSCERHWDLVTIHRHDFEKKIQAQRQSENLLLYPEIEPVPARRCGSWRWLSFPGSGAPADRDRESGIPGGHGGLLRQLPSHGSLRPPAPRELPGLLRHWLTHTSGVNRLLIRSSHQDTTLFANMSLSFRNCLFLIPRTYFIYSVWLWHWHAGVRVSTSRLGFELPYSLILISMLIWSVTLNFTSQEHKHNILLSVFPRDHEPPDPWAGLWLVHHSQCRPLIGRVFLLAHWVSGSSGWITQTESLLHTRSPHINLSTFTQLL